MKKFFLLFIKWILIGVCWLVTLLPYGIRKFLGNLLGYLWFDALRIRRSIILENLKIAFPELGERERIRLGRASCKNLGQGLMEFFWFPVLSPKKHSKLFNIEGREYLEQAEKKDKGVCLLTLHLGNGDMATAGLAVHGIKIYIISKFFEIQWINDIWFGLRRKLGTEFIPPRNSSYAILKALKKKARVAFVNDQFMGPPVGTQVRFFGKETGAAMGLAVIVSRTKAPVVPIYTFRDDKGVTQIRFEPEISFEEKETHEATIAHMTQVYTDKIEELVRRHPDQWLWVHRRWKVFRDSRKAKG